MKIAQSIVVAGAVAIATTAILATAVAQADPHSGTWVLNVAKSTYSPGPPPKEQTSVYAVDSKSVKVATKGTSADGKSTVTDFTAAIDGKDYPVTGNPDWDAVAVRRVDSQTIEFTRKRGGKVVQTAMSVVSKDGKTRTIKVSGINAQGQKISNVGVYEKR
jgi:hypothetical protein